MSATVIPAEVLEAKRRECDQQRRERQAFVGSILADDEDEPDQPKPVCSVASKHKGTTT